MLTFTVPLGLWGPFPLQGAPLYWRPMQHVAEVTHHFAGVVVETLLRDAVDVIVVTKSNVCQRITSDRCMNIDKVK